jgi:hypothetical protein
VPKFKIYLSTLHTKAIRVLVPLDRAVGFQVPECISDLQLITTRGVGGPKGELLSPLELFEAP